MSVKKTGQFILILIIATTWVFSGWPQIFNFPPETQKAQALDVANGNGILFYAAAANTTPQWRTYNNATNDFSANSNTVAGAQPVINVIKTSPTKQEAIAAYQDTSGNLRVLCYNGTSWSEDWTIAVAASGTPTTRRFDIAYETNTGNVTVAYSRNTAAVNALAYRTKTGSSGCGSANWAAAVNFPTTTTATSNTVMWVKAARDGRSAQNLSAWVWLDNAATNADLGGAIWSGSAFTNFKQIETSMEHQTAVGDSDNFDVQAESLSGEYMVVWGNSGGAAGVNGYRYMTCTGGTSSCTWSALLTMPTTLDEVMTIDLSADPLSNKLAMAGIGGASFDMSAGYWDGTGPWIGYANVDITTETTVAVGSKKVTTGWLTNGANTKWYIAYDDATDTVITYKYAINGGALSSATYTCTPALGDLRGRFDTDINPFNNAQLIMTISDSTNGIFAYRLSIDDAGALSWSNMTSAVSLGTKPSHPQQGFSYQYWRFIPTPTFSQSAYRLFNNADSTNVGTTLAAQDTAATLGSTGTAFRLRMLLHIDVNQLAASGQTFKLQFAQQSGACDTAFSGETYADVTAATVIAYNNNTTPADGATLTANGSDPTHGGDTISNQTYEELNNFTNSVAAIPSDQDGKWDFSLFDNGATANTAYCLRAVKSDDTVLDTYNVIPQITTTAAVAISISLVSPTTSGSLAFTTLALGTTKNTTSSGINDTEIISVDSGPANLDIKSTHFIEGANTWFLGLGAGTTQVQWQFSKNAGVGWTAFAAANTLYGFDTNVAQGNTRPVDFEITMPTSTNSYNQYSTTVTIQASAP